MAANTDQLKVVYPWKDPITPGWKTFDVKVCKVQLPMYVCLINEKILSIDAGIEWISCEGWW